LRPGEDSTPVTTSTPHGWTWATASATFDWQLAEVPDGLRLVLAGGLTPSNVADAIAQVHPWGVDVVTGVESSPGRKDPVKVRAFVAAAKAAGARPYVPADDGPFDQDDV
jgi:phosphoribosylanthranilate isomerase